MTMTFELHATDFRFLANHLIDGELKDIFVTASRALGTKPTKGAVSLEDAQVENVLDELGDLIAKLGVTNGEINEFGRHIENYIDIFAPQYYCDR